MRLGKLHRVVYEALKDALPKRMAKECLVKLYNTTLHPSLLCESDFECWADWEAGRIVEKEGE